MRAVNTAKIPQTSGLGLDSIGDLSGLLNEPETNGSGQPLELSLDIIDEDPNQPRREDNPGFSPKKLKELAKTICDRGVKTPISVRDNPNSPGRHIINHGACRYRASKIAGKSNIPAYIDNDYNDTDKMIENLHRNELTSREIADFIGRVLAMGKKKSEIAKELGKSPAFVTQHVTLLNLPDPIADAFNTGRAADVTVINELVKSYKKNPEEVTIWLADDSQELTRGSVKLLREFLDDKHQHEKDEDGRDPNTVDAFTGNTDAEREEGEKKSGAKLKEADPEKLKKAIVMVKHDGRPARLVLNRRPAADGYAWLKYEVDGLELEVDLAQVELVAIMEG